jgi:hypothetical protein
MNANPEGIRTPGSGSKQAHTSRWTKGRNTSGSGRTVSRNTYFNGNSLPYSQAYSSGTDTVSGTLRWSQQDGRSGKSMLLRRKLSIFEWLWLRVGSMIAWQAPAVPR